MRFKMICTINGEVTELPASTTLSQYLRSIELVEEHVVVEHNKSVVARGAYAETRLTEGDQLEILSFVGGG